MIHYKLHSNDGAAWCGKFITRDGEKSERIDDTATDKEAVVSCPDCNAKIKAFALQIGTARKDRKDPKFLACRRA
jgi:hypothetical protein